MVIPQWLKKHMTSEEAQRLTKVVAFCEKHTSAEIRPMVVRSSTSFWAVPILLRLAGLCLLFFIWSFLRWEFYWDHFERALLFWTLGLAGVLFFIPWCVHRLSLERWWVPQSEMRRRVFERAQLEFYLHHMQATKTGHGVLFFISLLERQIVVLADDAIVKKLPPETWKQLVKKVIDSGLNKNQLAWALESGLKECSQILAKEFPIQPDDVNELPNYLIIKE